MATSFSRKKHHDERVSEASELSCTRFQLFTKHLETVSIFGNHFMFLQMVEKKDTNSLSETEANWTQNSIFFSNQFPVQEIFLAFFTFNRVCMTKPLLRIREKCVLSRNTDYNKVWNKLHLQETGLDRRHLSSFKSIHQPFLDYISFKRYLQPVIWGFAVLWGQKFTKIAEFWWNK